MVTEAERQREAEQQLRKEYDNRADFLRRLFAVIVSVGFANQLIQMDSVRNGVLPSGQDVPHLAYLCVGLLLIIQSWDYYFSSIEKKPLTWAVRFYTDIVIVFAYLFLLTYSSSVLLSLLIVFIIFVLYGFWDFLSYREHPEHYPRKAEDNAPSYGGRLWYAMWDETSPLRPKLSTILGCFWFGALYFIYLDAIHSPAAPSYLKSPWLYFALTLGGLIGYRSDQSTPRKFFISVLPAAVGVIVFLYVHFHFER
jgi:uncharacterized membrane protein